VVDDWTPSTVRREQVLPDDRLQLPRLRHGGAPEVGGALVLEPRLELREEEEDDSREAERGDREEEERKPVLKRPDAQLHLSRKW
jgi:hypothetical protein